MTAQLPDDDGQLLSDMFREAKVDVMQFLQGRFGDNRECISAVLQSCLDIYNTVIRYDLLGEVHNRRHVQQQGDK